MVVEGTAGEGGVDDTGWGGGAKEAKEAKGAVGSDATGLAAAVVGVDDGAYDEPPRRAAKGAACVRVRVFGPFQAGCCGAKAEDVTPTLPRT